MRIQTTFLTALAVSGLILLSTSGVQADARNKKTNLTVNQTIEVPGAVLEPGKYVVKLVDSQSNRHIVRFLNEREDKVISTVIAIPNSRMEPTGDTEFSWYETPQGEPPALRAWFYPGDNFGQEFVYPERQGRELATRIDYEVPTMEPEETVVVSEQRTEEVREPVVVKETETVIIAQAQEPQQPQTRETQQQERSTTTDPAAQTERPSPIRSDATDDALPETAGPAPLLALLGLLSMGSALALRKVRKG